MSARKPMSQKKRKQIIKIVTIAIVSILVLAMALGPIIGIFMI